MALITASGAPDLASWDRTSASAITKIAYVTRGLPHYRVPVLDQLRARGIECDVVLAGELEPGFPTERAERGNGVTRLSSSGRFWRHDVVRLIQRAKPGAILLEHGASLDFTWTALLSRSLRGIPKVLWTHGIERRELFTNRHGFSSLGRWWQLRMADAIICYDRGMADLLASRFPRKVVGCAPNSTDGVGLSVERARLEGMGQNVVRSELGLSRKHYILGLGRLIKEKEFHRLVGILKIVRRAGIDVGAILVGEGPEMGSIRALAESTGLEIGNDLILPGAISNPARLARWLYCADLSVVPGYAGLAIVDCLFVGLPTVTRLPGRSGPYHSPEWKYVEHGVNGWIVPQNSDRAMAQAVMEYLSLPDGAREGVAQACVEYARRHLGVERMVDGMIEVLRSLIGLTAIAASENSRRFAPL